MSTHCQAIYKGQVHCQVGYMGNDAAHDIDSEGRVVHVHANLTWVDEFGASAIEAHVEEYETMYALLIAGGTIAHDATNEARAWARTAAPYPGMKTADCSDEGQCCYNALTDSCDNSECECHTYDATHIVAPF